MSGNPVLCSLVLMVFQQLLSLVSKVNVPVDTPVSGLLELNPTDFPKAFGAIPENKIKNLAIHAFPHPIIFCSRMEHVAEPIQGQKSTG